VSDPLIDVVELPENQKTLREALQTYLDKGEVTPALKFYMNLYAPRAAKLVGHGDGQVNGKKMSEEDAQALIDELATAHFTEKHEFASQPSY